MWFLYLLFVTSALGHSQMAREVAQFARSNGFVAITLVPIKVTTADRYVLKDLIRSLSDLNIQCSVLPLEQLTPEKYEIISKDFIFSSISDQDEWEQVLDILSHIRVQSSLVLTSMNPSLRTSAVPKNVHTYLYHLSTPDWLDVITVARTSAGLITNPLTLHKVNSLTSLAMPLVDFKKMTIVDESLTWLPMYSVTNCRAENKECVPGGALGSTAVFLEQMLNITIAFGRNPENDWGIDPFEFGAKTRCSNWTGVLGNLVKGQNHISISGFFMVAKRSGLIDMAWQHTDYSVLVIGDRMLPSIDVALLLRPFHPKVWMAIATWAVSALVCFLVMRKIPGLERTFYRVFITSTLLSFTLLHAFYSGALTMFFANEPDPPFRSLEGAMDAYPKWQLLIAMDEAFYNKPTEFHSQSYIDFWERANSKAMEDVYVESSIEGLRRVALEQAAFQMLESGFNYMRRKQAVKEYTYNVVAEKITKTHVSAALPFNSPLTRAVAESYLALKEYGVTQKLVQNWGANSKKKRTKAVTQTPLSIGKLVSAYLLMGVALVLSPIILGAELLTTKLMFRAKIVPENSGYREEP